MAKINLLERLPLKSLLWMVLSTLLALFVLASALVYFFPGLKASEKLGRLFPYPVASIGMTDFVTSRSLGEDMDSIRRFYESQDFSKIGLRIDFSTQEGRDRLKIREKDLLNKLLEDAAIKRVARESGIVVTPAEAQSGIEAKLKELGTGAQVEQSLSRLYGWTLSDFGEKVVLPSLYEEKLSEKFNKDDNGKKAAREKITAAAAALKKSKDFAAVAKEYSEGQTASEGGELGWFTTEDLAPDLQKPVSEARLRTPTEIVESSLGYHILYIEESKLQDGKRLYHLRQIFTKKPSFSEWLSGKMQKMPVRIYSREYEWDVKDAEVKFRSRDLQEAEKKLREKAAGDPSLVL